MTEFARGEYNVHPPIKKQTTDSTSSKNEPQSNSCGDQNIDIKSFSEITNDVCIKKPLSQRSACTERVNSIIQNFKGSLSGPNIKKGSYLNKINGEINHLNRLLKNIWNKRKVRVTKYHDGNHYYEFKTYELDLEDEETKIAYQGYREFFLRIALSKDGFVFLTNHFRKNGKGFREFRNALLPGTIFDKNTILTANGDFNEIPPANCEDLDNALEEIQKGIKENIQSLIMPPIPSSSNNRQRTAEGRKLKNHFKELLKNNPASVFSALVDYPEQAGKVCSALQEIQNENKHQKGVEDGVPWASLGIMAGLGLVATGVGAPLGKALIVKSGIALAGAMLAFNAGKSYQYHNIYQKTMNGIYSENAKEQSFLNSRLALSDHHNFFRSALIDTAFLAVFPISSKVNTTIKGLRNLRNNRFWPHLSFEQQIKVENLKVLSDRLKNTEIFDEWLKKPYILLKKAKEVDDILFLHQKPQSEILKILKLKDGASIDDVMIAYFKRLKNIGFDISLSDIPSSSQIALRKLLKGSSAINGSLPKTKIITKTIQSGIPQKTILDNPSKFKSLRISLRNGAIVEITMGKDAFNKLSKELGPDLSVSLYENLLANRVNLPLNIKDMVPTFGPMPTFIINDKNLNEAFNTSPSSVSSVVEKKSKKIEQEIRKIGKEFNIRFVFGYGIYGG